MNIARLFLPLTLVVMVSCNTASHKEEEVLAFLNDFSASLAKDETEAYAYFSPGRSSLDESMRALHSLRGWDTLVTVHPYWKRVVLSDHGDTVLVELPVTLRSAEVPRDSAQLVVPIFLVRVDNNTRSSG